jgi:hypothetical protein
MGVPNSEVGYTSATTGRGDHEVHKGHVVALEKKDYVEASVSNSQNSFQNIRTIGRSRLLHPSNQVSKFNDEKQLNVKITMFICYSLTCIC